MKFRIEVQHSSDNDKDEKWHELDIIEGSEIDAQKSVDWFIGYRNNQLTSKGYYPRPVRYVQI